jgi:hypothetical protein
MAYLLGPRGTAVKGSSMWFKGCRFDERQWQAQEEGQAHGKRVQKGDKGILSLKGLSQISGDLGYMSTEDVPKMHHQQDKL